MKNSSRIIILALFSPVLFSQYRIKPPDFKPTYYIGATTGYNGITGILVERNLKQKDGYPSTKSTISFMGGYSLRQPKLLADPFRGKYQRVWVNGLGFGILLNNYVEKIKRGWFWNFGIATHLFFNNSQPVIYEESGEPYYGKKKLKEFSVTASGGYRFDISKEYSLSPSTGIGFMGTPFVSTTSSDLNGVYFYAGITLVHKMTK